MWTAIEPGAGGPDCIDDPLPRNCAVYPGPVSRLDSTPRYSYRPRLVPCLDWGSPSCYQWSRDLRVFNKPGNDLSTPVWVAKIPVIAENDLSSNASSICGSTGLGSLDPAIIESRTFEIIGFVNVTIFDTDVGPLPLNPSDPTDRSLHAAPFQQDWCHGWDDISTMPPLAPNSHEFTDPNATGPNPWFFQIEGTAQACNAVRGRVNCDTNFIASSSNEGELAVRLVD